MRIVRTYLWYEVIGWGNMAKVVHEHDRA